MMKPNMPKIDPNGRYTVGQTAELLGVNRTTIWRWVKAGKLHPYVSRVNDRIRFKGQDILYLWNAEF